MNTKIASYAQLGKAELIQAIGVASDYDELLGLDLNMATESVETVVKNKKHSEKEQYGDKKRLSTAPLLFWIYLHYLSPDADGMVCNISITAAAEYLNLSVKAIRKSVEKLTECGYIYSSRIVRNMVTVKLVDFPNYFKQRSEGGHGYLELSEENFLNIVKIASERIPRGSKDPNSSYTNKCIINKIRIKIRSFIMCDHAQRQFKRNKKADTTVTKSVKELLRFLPDYLYPKKMIELLDCIRDTISFVVFGDKIKMNANVEDFNGVKQRNTLIHSLTKNVKSKLNEINNALLEFNNGDITDPYELTDYEIYLVDEGIHCNTYTFSNDEIKDIAKLCLQYSEESVYQALGYIYSNFIIKGRTIVSMGALLRACICSQI